MSEALAEAVARVWPDGRSTWEVLGGGITNHNVKVTRPDGVLVLRVAGKDTDLLGIDRTVELAATRAAAEAGVGTGGRRLRRAGGMARHPLRRRVDPRRPRRFASRSSSVASRGRSGPSTTGRRYPGGSTRSRSSRRIGTRPSSEGRSFPTRSPRHTSWRGGSPTLRADQPPRACHNDLLNANFIDDGERLVIVDWEYAGMGDPFFDLANFSINHELDAEGRAVLLAAYAGDAHAAGLATLDLQRFMSDFREAMWGVVQGVVSELDFDFAAYAAEHFERMERTASEPAFRRALDA